MEWESRQRLITELTDNFGNNVEKLTYSKPNRGDIYFSTSYRRWKVASKSFKDVRLMARTRDEFDDMGWELALKIRPYLVSRSDSSIHKLADIISDAARLLSVGIKR